jgi:hypothetical protein
MGYHTIRLDPDASKICTIIFPWGKYFYKQLTIGIAGCSDIIQGKMSELMESLEYVQVYLDDLLCTSRSSLEDHLEKLEEVLKRLCYAGLKINAEKLTFCVLEIEYLEYVLTRYGVKPQKNKVQAIFMIQPPTGVEQLQHFLGMVQYTSGQDGAKCSPLSPHLLESVVRPKSQEPKGLRRCPGIWTRSIKELLIM